jgi:hypothetical protein
MDVPNRPIWISSERDTQKMNTTSYLYGCQRMAICILLAWRWDMPVFQPLYYYIQLQHSPQMQLLATNPPTTMT